MKPRSSWKHRARVAVHRSALRLLSIALDLRPREARTGERPRVTFLLAHAYGIGGTTRTCLNLAGFLSADHEVEVLSVLRRRETPLFAHPPGITVTPLDESFAPAEHPLVGLLRRVPSVLLLPADRNMQRRTSLYTDIVLVRALWRVRSGVLIGTRPSLNALAVTTRRRGLAVIAQEHMNFETHRVAMRAELLRIYRTADVAVLLTERDRDAFRSALGPGPALAVIPNAVPQLPGGSTARRHQVVLAVGRLTRQKGFDRLIPAFAEVVRTRPDWTLRICGGGPVRQELEQLVAGYGLGDHVKLLGQVRHVEREMARASIYVLSSRSEGLPMALIEAMSEGLAVVAFDCPTGPGEIIEHGRTGLLIADGDVAGLADGLLQLIGDEGRRVRMGAAGRLRAGMLSIDVVGPMWAALIADLL